MTVLHLPMNRIDGIDATIGDFWKGVVNRLGGQPVSPDVYLPLLDEVLAPFASWTILTHAIGMDLAGGVARARIVADVERARLAFRIWHDRRPALQSWIDRTGSRVAARSLRRLWFLGANRLRDLDRENRIETLMATVPLEAGELVAIYHQPELRGRMGQPSIAGLRRDLRWVDQLERLREVARKTWPADPSARVAWSEDDLAFVNSYYRHQNPELDATSAAPFDPFELTVWNGERGLPPPIDGLHAAMTVLLQTAVVDFADELLERTRRPTARGSLACIECGRFVGRRALGTGQLYCSEQCKKRAAKRRHRRHARERHESSGATSPAMIVDRQ